MSRAGFAQNCDTGRHDPGNVFEPANNCLDHGSLPKNKGVSYMQNTILHIVTGHGDPLGMESIKQLLPNGCRQVDFIPKSFL
jgi:hypothetical protein